MDHLPFNLVAVLVVLGVGKPIAVAIMSLLTRRQAERHGYLYGEATSPAQRSFEWRAVVWTLTDVAVFGVFVAIGLFRFTGETLGRAVVTFLVMFFAVDAWMYANHVAMHRVPLFMKWHRHHHLSVTTGVETAISFSFMEKLVCYTLGWLGIMAALSWVLPISMYGICAFYVFYFFSSAYGHGNVELLADKSPPGRFSRVSSATAHGLHHQRGNRNYAFLTTIYDHLFGTAATEEDYERAGLQRQSAPSDAAARWLR
jgi:sterol desaturase/sphingolipid hydroxylase (fatty acid hydroxylase superfamily)